MTDPVRTAEGASVLAHGQLDQHEATLESVDGERATISCAVPYAPGKPATLALALEPPLRISLKTIGSKRRSDGRFEIRARIVMLRREERERLAALRAAVLTG